MIAFSFLLSAAVAATPVQARTAEPQSPGARIEMQRFGACVVDASGAKAAATLRMDFRDPAYRSAMRALADNNRNCLRARGRMRSAGLSFAASMAEALLAKGEGTMKSRLARAAAAPATTAFTPTDAQAICVVRAMPDEVSALFATPVASEDEKRALAALAIGVQRCAAGGTPVEYGEAGLRSVLATAAYRQTVAAGQGS